MSPNRAAWATKPNTSPFEIDDAAMPQPGPRDLIIKAAAWAINPIDWKLQNQDVLNLNYPAIFGCDVAGTVFQLGSDVGRFTIGDRVTSHALVYGSKKNEEGAFQLYVRCGEGVTVKLPDGVEWKKGVVVPSALSATGLALFEKRFLGLGFPGPVLGLKAKNKSLLIWGGSSSLGMTAIQLAKRSNLRVVTTASGRNLEKLRTLGADVVVNYTRNEALDELIEGLKGEHVVGAFDAIGGETTTRCAEVLQQCGGNQLVATVAPPPEDLPDRVTAKMIASVTIAGTDLATRLFEWGTEALERGTFIPAPEPFVVGKGLESIQTGLEISERGVSGQKVVVLA